MLFWYGRAMELRQIRYFIATAEQLNFTRAAEQMGVAQPALSRQVRALEEELGVQLLERDSRQVSLTAAGQMFLEDTREVLELLEAAEARVRRAQQNSVDTLRIGYGPTLVAPWLKQILGALNERLPNTKIQLFDMDNGEMIQAIRENRMDLGLMPDSCVPRSDIFVVRALEKIKFEVAMPVGHRLADRTELTVRDLGPEALIGYDRKQFPEYLDHLGQIYRGEGQALIFAHEVDSGGTLAEMLRAEQGVAIVSSTFKTYYREGLVFVPIFPEPEGVYLSLVSHRDAPAQQMQWVDEAFERVFG